MVVVESICDLSTVIYSEEFRPDMEVDTTGSPGKLPVTSQEAKDPMRDSLLSSDCEVEVDIAQVGTAPLQRSPDSKSSFVSTCDGGGNTIFTVSNDDKAFHLPNSSHDCPLPISPCRDDIGTLPMSSCSGGEMENPRTKYESTSDLLSETSVPSPLSNDGQMFRKDTEPVSHDALFWKSDKDSLQTREILEVSRTSDSSILGDNSEAFNNFEHRTSEKRLSRENELLHTENELSLHSKKFSELTEKCEFGEDSFQAPETQQTSGEQVVQKMQSMLLEEKLSKTSEPLKSNEQPLSVDEVVRTLEEQSPDQSLQSNESRASDRQPMSADAQVWEAVGQCEDVFRPEADEESPFPSLSPERRENGQPELEFDDWQGQFEFCSPALQDCQFVLPGLMHAIELGAEGNGSVYRDLIYTVKQLQNKVEVLGDNQSDSQDRIVRVKQENSVLQERVVMLEEQLREVEHRADERLAEEQRRNRELIQRVEREKSLTVENCTIKQEHLEKTTQRLEEELQRLRSKTDRHQRERNELENRLSEAQILAANLKEENKVLASQSKKELLQDQEQSAKVIEELRAEVERLTAVLESNGRKRVPSTDSITASTDQLTAALTALRQENKSLEEQVEELQAQLLTRGLEEGRELITAAANQSLAAEFDAMTQEEVELKERETVEELQKSLHDVQEANKQLRTYIDGILLTIVENHPQLLEVKRKSS